MINFNTPLVVFGAGSIGERHIQILQELGYKNIHVYRQRNLPLRQIDAITIEVFTDISKLDEIKPAAAFITSPTSFHIQQGLLCASKGIHTLIEKPLANDDAELDKLQTVATENNTLVQVAYMLRYHPAFKKLKKIFEGNEYGKLLSFHTHWGEYLPDWHPWEDYRQSYAALKSLGGGAALTLSHDLDIINWLIDEPVLKHHSVAHHTSTLEVDVESAVDFIFSYKSGTTGHIHLNFFQKIPHRLYQFVFENAFVQYNYFKNILEIETTKEKTVVDFKAFERNEMFREQTKNFIETINVNKDFSALSAKQINESKAIISLCNF